ncbi:MAG: alpha/beta hydrolase [Dehalococcoidia bacterium]|nr:alpha/beta hydrolase [Dehalococcoidia bacterium]
MRTSWRSRWPGVPSPALPGWRHSGRDRSCSAGRTRASPNERIREIQDELRERRGSGGLREHALSDAFEQENPALTTLYRQMNALNPKRPRGMLGRPPATYTGSMHGPLANMGVPVLFVVGEHDLITSPELIQEAVQLLPGAGYYEVADAGHSAYFERAEVWNSVVLEFLRNAERGDTPG